MPCYTPVCLKWTLLGFSLFFVSVGFLLIVFTDDLVEAVKAKKLNVGSNHTTEYNFWKETPIPMYIEFYLFNWTNWREVVSSGWKTKPAFKQFGPYTWHEKHIRKNVIFNDNRTVTYKTQRIWHFEPEKTVGSLDDLITTVNPILLTVADIVKYKHPIVRMGVNFFLEEKMINLTVTKTIREFIFDGYDDPLIDLLKKIKLRNINIPYTKFGWFVERNGSVDYDGVYNMYDGSDDVRKLGRFAEWNYKSRTGVYPGDCGKVRGTSGELWYPVQDDAAVEVFSPDTCSTLTLSRTGVDEKFGLQGNTFSVTERTLDNGTKYAEMACFSSGEILPSGVRNVSQCKMNSPAFLSFPHFYLADPYYRNAVDGMQPNETEHKVLISIEPETGIPLQAKVAAQLNLRIEKIDKIKLLENVNTVYMPCFWFKQYAVIDEDLANQAKLLILLPSIGQNTGYGLLGLGCLLLSVFLFLTWTKVWKGSQDEALLNQEAL